MRIKLFPVLLAAALAAGQANGQELRARVQGVITDSSGAVAVGAKITMRNVNTGVQEERESNANGQYLFDFVSPGSYALRVELAGFRTFIQENILAQTRGDVTVNAALELGAVAETINVIESPVAVQFNSTTMETTLDTKMSTDLPIIHRNPFLLLMVDPQVVYTSTSAERSPYHHWAGSRMDVGGGTELKNDILVDGSPNTWGPKTNYVPPMDAVSELNVQQNATDAEFGHSAGGIVSLQMKSGTNDFHGTAYFMGRNPKLNAMANRLTRSPSVIRHNVWGVTSSNPIKKNKIFNFLSYEGQNLREPTDIVVTAPTALEREGNFSQSRNITGAVRQIFDPSSTLFNPATNAVTRTQFPNNTIPRSAMDPTSLRFLRDIWAPNRAGDDITGVNNYRITHPRVFEYWNLTNRTDWQVNERWKIFGRFSRFRTVQTSPDVTGSPAQNSSGSQRNSTQVVGDAVYMISARTILSIRGSYGKPVDRFEFPQGEIKSIAEFWPGNPSWFDAYARELPVLYYPGLNVGGSNFGRAGYWYSAPDFWNFQGKLSQQRGRHYLKFGGEYRDFNANSTLPRPTDFRFGAASTANTFINPDVRLRGDAWAAFLLGVMNNDSFVRTLPLIEARSEFFGFYFQDDFKVNQKLTLNLGLRWEYDTPLNDARGRFSRYVDLANPIPEFQGAGAPAMPREVASLRREPLAFNGAWIFTDDQHPNFYNSPQKTLLPRAGIAYRLNDRAVVRIGYSRYAIPPSVNDNGGINLNDVVPYPGFSQDSFPLPMLEGIPQARLRDPFPRGVNPIIEPPAKRLGRYTELGSIQQSVYSFQNLKNAYNDRFNFTYQFQTVSQIVVDLTYFVSLGRNHYYLRELNDTDPQYGYDFKALVTQRVNNPFFNILTPEKFPGGLRTQSQVTVNTLLRPYPHYGRLTQWNTPGISRHYQALQIKVQRPFANGLNLLAGYNYHRFRNDEFYDPLDRYHDRLTMQDSADPRHKLSVASVYELPFGRGRKFLANAPRGADLLLGGWGVSGIYEYVGGPFLRFGAALVSANPRISNPTRDRMFDTLKFTRQPDFTRRNNPLQFPGVHGPRYVNLDLTLAKTYRLSERLGFELRAEAYNITNSFMGANPNLNVDSSLFGRVVSQRPAFFGRQIQYVGRLRW